MSAAALTHEQLAWDRIVQEAKNALHWRKRKAELQAQLARGPLTHEITPALCEATARRCEARVREFALRAEIQLSRLAA